MTTKTFIEDDVVRCKVEDLQPGQRVDLEGDEIADWDYLETEHPEFAFEFEVVEYTQFEPHDVDPAIVVFFESGFVCGFPVGHAVDVDGEQSP